MESVIADGWAARTCSAGRPGIAVTSGGGTSRNENSRSAVPSGSVLRSSCLTWWQRLAYACEKLTMACALASQNAPIVAAISSWAGASGSSPAPDIAHREASMLEVMTSLQCRVRQMNCDRGHKPASRLANSMQSTELPDHRLFPYRCD